MLWGDKKGSLIVTLTEDDCTVVSSAEGDMEGFEAGQLAEAVSCVVKQVQKQLLNEII